MAARKQLWHPDEVRQKIQVSQLLNRLHDHAYGEIELSPTQVRSIEVLLRKAIPDLSSTEVRHDGTVTYVIEAPPLATSLQEWARTARETAVLIAPPKPGDTFQ